MTTMSSSVNTDLEDAQDLLAQHPWMVRTQTIRATLQRRLNWQYERAMRVARLVAKERRER